MKRKQKHETSINSATPMVVWLFMSLGRLLSKWEANSGLSHLGCPFSDPPLKGANLQWVRWRLPQGSLDFPVEHHPTKRKLTLKWPKRDVSNHREKGNIGNPVPPKAKRLKAKKPGACRPPSHVLSPRSVVEVVTGVTKRPSGLQVSAEAPRALQLEPRARRKTQGSGWIRGS